ncbi:enkurin-like [Antennarius striatus]|uniref:enkurin-like n=1 Tax=Antennarius striatus TaxID=241820 RepID=UPI0035B05C2C
MFRNKPLVHIKVDRKSWKKEPKKKVTKHSGRRPPPKPAVCETVGSLFTARHMNDLYGDRLPEPVNAKANAQPPTSIYPPVTKEKKPTIEYVKKEMLEPDPVPIILTKPTSKQQVHPPTQEDPKNEDESMKPKVYTKKTMGPLTVDKPCPKHFLRKHSKEPVLPQQLTEFVRPCVMRRAPVPRWNDNPPIIHREQNFVKQAIEEPYTTIRPEPAQVDIKGHREVLQNSGLVPKYTLKRDFGILPGYLQNRLLKIRIAKESYDNHLKCLMDQEARKFMSEEQRKVVLHKLIHWWLKVPIGAILRVRGCLICGPASHSVEDPPNTEGFTPGAQVDVLADLDTPPLHPPNGTGHKGGPQSL